MPNDTPRAGRSPLLRRLRAIVLLAVSLALVIGAAAAFRGVGRWLVRPIPCFDADHWWRNTRDAFSVVRELMGLLNVWTGLRVHPHSA